jgi:peptide/nickel transport system permease protein
MSADREQPVAPPTAHGADSRIALGVLLLIVLAALLAPWLSPHDPQRLLDPIGLRSAMPSLAHPLGTDPLSRDILSRMLHGARVSWAIAAGAVALATIMGTAIGIAAGLIGGTWDRLLMRVVDVALAVPRIVVLLLIAGLWGQASVGSLTLLLGLTGWMGLTRVIRAEVRAARASDHVLAARALGMGPWRVLARHVFPALVPLLAVSASSGIGQVLLLESGLSILGIGVPTTTPSWGAVLLDVSDVIGTGRWLMIGPGMIMMCCVAAVFRVGDEIGSRDHRPRTGSGAAAVR